MSFWTRPTISWSLTCEDIDRKVKVMELMDKVIENTSESKLDYIGNILGRPKFRIGGGLVFISLVFCIGGC